MLRLVTTIILLTKMILFGTPSRMAGDFKLLILHTNDMHSHFTGTTKTKDSKVVGGFPRIAGIVRKARSESKAGSGPPVLYVDGGDIFSGSIWFNVHEERMASVMMNELKPDAVCLGFHEFDLGVAGLERYLKNIKFPVLASNIDFSNETSLEKFFKKSLVMTIKGVKIGIVGYLAPELTIWADIGGLKILNVVPSLKEVCQKLVKEEKVKIIIGVGHARVRIDKVIAQNVLDLDIIIGGSSHTLLWNGIPPDNEVPLDEYPIKVTQSTGKVVLIAHAFCCTKYLGHLTVTFSKNGKMKTFSGNPIYMNQSIPEDKQVLKIIETFNKTVVELNSTVIAKSKVYLDGTDCFRKECNYGNLITDAFVQTRAITYNGPGWTDAAIALMNMGSITGDINPPARNDSIYVADVYESLRYGDGLYITELTGKYLKAVLEMNTRTTDETIRGPFFATSGLKVVYDFQERFGQRVKSVKVRCADCAVPHYVPLNIDNDYKIILTYYVLKGGDGYTIIRDVSDKPISLGIRDFHAVTQYFNRSEFVMPEIGGRISYWEVPEDDEGMRCRGIPSMLVLMLILMYWSR